MFTENEERFQYNLKDHLGNTVVSFEDKDGDGVVALEGEVLQRSPYYPFGMGMDLPETGVLEEPGNLYLYNGKELTEDLQLNWLDFGFRWYDPAIARFPSVDPIIEEFPYLTAYNYASNNPITNIDLWGLQGIWFGTQGLDTETLRTTSQQGAKTHTALGGLVAARAHYKSDLAQNLILHYALGDGEKYTLNQNEMESVNVLSPNSINVKNTPGFKSNLANLKIGETFSIDHFETVAAGTAGTLGDHFEVLVEGCVTKCGSNGEFSFEGTMSFSDTFDFNLDAPKTNNYRKGLVTIGKVLMPVGTDFKIDSEKIPVFQNDSMETLDYFQGLSTERIPSVLGDERNLSKGN